MDSQFPHNDLCQVARAALVACDEQIIALEMHHSRLKTKTDRYQKDSMPWTLAMLEGLVNKEKLDLLRAIRAGKTVQPS